MKVFSIIPEFRVDIKTSPAVHILTGILPAEAMIHKRLLALYGSIYRLSDDSVEKQIGWRQLSIKSYSSHSWFVPFSFWIPLNKYFGKQ